jgi:hypothetical protein
MSEADEYEFEEIPGLPEALPPGESIVWRGKPEWQSLAWRAYHVREALIYFAAFGLFQVATLLANGGGIEPAMHYLLRLVPGAALAVAILGFLAWLSARTTIYTMTNRRIVMRIGIALPMTLNLPFTIVGKAGMTRFRDGTGDISLAFSGKERFAFMILWPHVRPWHIASTQPTLRAIAAPEKVAALLASVLTTQNCQANMTHDAVSLTTQKLDHGVTGSMTAPV